MFGYFPARLFGPGENLPKGVALEWASWGRHPRYLFGFGDTLDLSRYTTLTVPILAYSFDDDASASLPSVEALLRAYSAAEVTHRHVVASTPNQATIGHFGFFRERFRETLWQETLDWLEQQ